MATIPYPKQLEIRLCNQDGCIAVHQFDDGERLILYQVPWNNYLRALQDDTFNGMVESALVTHWQTIRDEGVTIQIYVSYRDRRLLIKQPKTIKYIRAIPMKHHP